MATIRKLREFEKSAKAQLKEYDELRTKVKAVEDAQMSEQERLSKRLAELEPLTESVREYEAVMTEMLETRLKGMTPEAKKAVESLPVQDPLSRLRWLTANEGLFARSAAPKLDGGTGSGTRTSQPALTAEQEEIARKMGVSPEKYAARLAEMKARET